VNLGARLEGLTKEYGVKILMSEFTVAALKEPRSFLYRDLDDIRVKGKTEPVRIFELMNPGWFKTPAEREQFMESFRDMRRFYKAKNWVEALGRVDVCLNIRPGDGPSLLYKERIGDFQKSPPVDDWDGVHNFSHK
jgi:adenylate cyclase